jgi:hypothetical protein
MDKKDSDILMAMIEREGLPGFIYAVAEVTEELGRRHEKKQSLWFRASHRIRNICRHGEVSALC